MEKIRINYNGRYPNLCSGRLEVWIGEDYFDFGEYVLQSGGGVFLDDEGYYFSECGDWYINDEDYPPGFPENRKQDLLDEINSEIPHGCCGGCA